MSENFSLRESAAEVQVEWRIERFLSLTEEPAYELHSPAFSLSDAQWFLAMRPKIYSADIICERICLNLQKRSSTSRIHELKYTLGIRRMDGSVYESLDSEDKFQKFGAPRMNLFAPRYVFGASELRRSENVLTADGTLTVFATVRLAEPTVLDEVEIADIRRELPFRATLTEEVTLEWKLEKFALLPKTLASILKSPTFSLAGATWCMEMHPNDFCSDDRHWISLYLSREGSSSEKQTVAFTLGIRKWDGTPHRLFHREKEFNTNTGYGSSYFIKSSELLDPENELVSKGSVTFFCTARAIRSPLATAAVTEGDITRSQPR